MLYALLSAGRRPAGGLQTIRRAFARNLSPSNHQWQRWNSTVRCPNSARHDFVFPQFNEHPKLDDHTGQHLLLTINPERYVSTGQKVLDISNASEVVLYCKGPSEQLEPIRLRCNASIGDRFPANTVGLFYGHRGAHRVFGDLRFRLCNNVDDFHQGTDLLQSDGRVWRISWHKLRSAPRRNRLLLHLVRSDYPEYGSWLPRSYPIHSFSPQNIVDKGGSVLDLSNKACVQQRFKDGGTAVFHYRRALTEKKFIPKPFPADTKGLLYYKQSATAPTAIGELRFRLCNDASSFDAGKDLCLPSGLPWCLPSHEILTAAAYKALRQQLYEEELLSPVAESFVGERGVTFLYGLNQPFAVNIGSSSKTIIFQLNKEGIKREMRWLFARDRMEGPLYTGRAVVQFERYPPENINSAAKHEPLFALRFLELLTPVTKTTHPDSEFVEHPKPGQYLRRRTLYGVYRTWGYTPYGSELRGKLSKWAEQTQVSTRPPESLHFH